jgi:hypothetical protein
MHLVGFYYKNHLLHVIGPATQEQEMNFQTISTTKLLATLQFISYIVMEYGKLRNTRWYRQTVFFSAELNSVIQKATIKNLIIS